MIAIDTGSCVHLITDKDWIVDFHSNESTTTKELYYGIGDTEDKFPLKIKGEGKIYIKVKEDLLSPTNVLYAPDLKESILSADRLAEELDITLEKDHHEMIFKDRMVITVKDNYTIWIRAKDILETSPKNIKHEKKSRSYIRAVRVAKPEITDLEAHLRLNHIPLEVIR